jgi:hypothetical protein
VWRKQGCHSRELLGVTYRVVRCGRYASDPSVAEAL